LRTRTRADISAGRSFRVNTDTRRRRRSRRRRRRRRRMRRRRRRRMRCNVGRVPVLNDPPELREEEEIQHRSSACSEMTPRH
jgi:hypothetical protein